MSWPGLSIRFVTERTTEIKSICVTRADRLAACSASPSDYIFSLCVTSVSVEQYSSAESLKTETPLAHPMGKPLIKISRKFQCSGSTRSTCFWASRIRIHESEVWIRMLLSAGINSKKTWYLLFWDFFLTFYLWKLIYVYRQKVISRKTFLEICFLLASWRSMTKITGSGSISQRDGSEEPA